MARPVYPYELDDPDFSWLISRFREERPEYVMIDCVTLPLTLVRIEEITMPGFVMAAQEEPDFEESCVEGDIDEP